LFDSQVTEEQLKKGIDLAPDEEVVNEAWQYRVEGPT
jgi:hypothetical protein